MFSLPLRLYWSRSCESRSRLFLIFSSSLLSYLRLLAGEFSRFCLRGGLWESFLLFLRVPSDDAEESLLLALRLGDTDEFSLLLGDSFLRYEPSFKGDSFGFILRDLEELWLASFLDTFFRSFPCFFFFRRFLDRSSSEDDDDDDEDDDSEEESEEDDDDDVEESLFFLAAFFAELALRWSRRSSVIPPSPATKQQP